MASQHADQEQNWRGHYLRVMEIARARAQAAFGQCELIACGFANNVDLVADLSPELLAKLIDGRSLRLDGPRQLSASTPDELVTSIVQHVAAGEGIDIPVSNPETQDWLIAQTGGRKQLGGTGAQIAMSLDTLGWPTLIHLTSCSPEQAAVFGDARRMRTVCDGELQTVAEAAQADDATMWHVALEYAPGLTCRVGEREINAPAGSRIIVSYDPINAAYAIRDDFIQTVARRADRIGKLLISGYSHATDRVNLDRLLAQSIEALGIWRAARSDLVIHLEMGAIEPASFAHVVETLVPHVTSIGMNSDELRDLAIAWGFERPVDLAATLQFLREVRRRLPVPRFSVHSATWAMTITDRDPETERDALLFGALAASTRATTGVFPTLSDAEQTLATCVPSATGLRGILDVVPDGIARCGDHWIVVVPTIEVPHLRATVGLGDSFTAGMLSML